MDRRQFIKTAGAGAATMGLAAACKNIPSAQKAGEGVPENGEMPYRENKGDRVSLLGYGCMRWPMIRDEQGNEIIDQEKVEEMVDYAIAHGVNYFDSAPVYLQGQSEEATAKALSKYPRNSYFIATKLSNHRGFEPSFEEGVEMFRRSLKYYNTDHIDYYLMHNIGGEDPFTRRFVNNGLLEFLLKEREEGHIRNLGFSFHGTRDGFDYLMSLHGKYHWDFVQIQMNYIDWTHAGEGATDAEYLYGELEKRGIPVIVMEPLLGGQLSSVPQAVAKEMMEREPDKSVASWAFRFVASHPGILTTLSGMTYLEHLQDNLKTFLDFKPLNDEEYAFLERMASLIKDYPLVGCTGCSYCMPCPYGIDIPGIFRHYNTCVNEGLIAQSSAQEDFKKLRRKYITTYDKAIESVRQADHCISCGQCLQRCPQRIKIPTELQRIDRYVEQLKRETI